MKRLDFELYGSSWKNHVKVDGEEVYAVADLHIHLDRAQPLTRIDIGYWPLAPSGAEDQPIRLTGYLVDTDDPSGRTVAGVILTELLDKLPELPILLDGGSHEQEAWLRELNDWAAKARRTASRLVEPV